MRNLIFVAMFVSCAPRTGPAGLNGVNGTNGVNGLDGITSTIDLIYMCHKYKNNGNHYVEMYVPEYAVQEHFDHGDFLGECN